MGTFASLNLLTSAILIFVFVVVAIRTIRHPWRANVDALLLFGTLAIIVVERGIFAVFDGTRTPWVGLLDGILVLLIPYLCLRLVDDFAVVPTPVVRLAQIGVVSFVGIAALVFGMMPPLWLRLLAVVYFVGFLVYSALAFAREGKQSRGVTKRRMWAVAIGFWSLGLGIIIEAGSLLAPDLSGVLLDVSRLLTLVSVLSLFVGFATPGFLRRLWQGPELRAFLERIASLPGLTSEHEVVRELEEGTALALGVPHAAIACWDEQKHLLSFSLPSGERVEMAPGQGISGEAFVSQRPIFLSDLTRTPPSVRRIAEQFGATSAMAAPITAGRRRIGAIVVYAKRQPIFAEDDLALLEILANQAAVVIENHALVDELARLRAREEVTRLKEDFLSAAAHELKTPLTVLSGQAQFLERRSRHDPEAPVDLERIDRIVEASKRLDNLVQRLLAVARIEPGEKVGNRELVDLVALAQHACERFADERHRCVIDASSPVVGELDRSWVERLLENLVENAVVYSPEGGDVDIRIWQEDAHAFLNVTDHGIGVPASDIPRLFERFYRASNVDPRRFPGLGIGLFTSKAIVQDLGGQIWVTSPGPNQGTTVHVVLPLLGGVPSATSEAISSQ